jgi:hypothetical protein
MQSYENRVLISYAWGGKSEEIVNEIDRSLQSRGLKIVRDKRDLDYKDSIKDFMELIGRGNCVIVVISDKYLRSPNCMFELVEIAENKQFHDRVFPIVLTDANIYEPLRRIEYVKHWELKRAELAESMRTLDPANLQGIRDDMDLYDRIRDKISGLTSILKDMNTLTPEMHHDSDFHDLYAEIEKRLRESDSNLPSKIKRRNKRIERNAERHKKNTGVMITCVENNLELFTHILYTAVCEIVSTLGVSKVDLTLGETQFITLQPGIQYQLTIRPRRTGLGMVTGSYLWTITLAQTLMGIKSETHTSLKLKQGETMALLYEMSGGRGRIITKEIPS